MSADPESGPAPAGSTPPHRHTVRVGEVDIVAWVWEVQAGVERPRSYLLIHGTAARSEWWDAIAPLLTSDGRVAALDLSGHGGSGRRADYELATWVDEVVAIARALFGDDPVTLVGHSLGGLVAVQAAWAHPELFRGPILLDCPLRRLTPEQREKREAIARRPLPRYDTLEEAVASFKTVPRTPAAPRELIQHIARHSYRRDGAGWMLHFDPAVYRRVTDVAEFQRPYPDQTYCVRAEHGYLDGEMARGIVTQLPGPERMITVPGVGHNLVLEQPIACAWLIRGLASSMPA